MEKRANRVKGWKKTALIVLLLIICYFIWENNTLEMTQIAHSNGKLPTAFDGFKILQVSDLHNREFGKNSGKLLEKVRGESPDIIVLTGDLVDSRHTNFEKALAFTAEAVEIAPVYYVSGNHESRLDNYWYLKEQLQKQGVTVLDNEGVTVSRGESSITLLGLTDPDFYLGAEGDLLAEHLHRLKGESGENFTLLLSHRPERIETYTEAGVDLVFSGHAHGGQIRLPLIGALVAPQQGFFPQYTMGSYEFGDTTLIVSRGVGNSLIPFRTLNRPELVSVTLRAEG